jgi:hypothetical protein
LHMSQSLEESDPFDREFHVGDTRLSG